MKPNIPENRSVGLGAEGFLLVVFLAFVLLGLAEVALSATPLPTWPEAR